MSQKIFPMELVLDAMKDNGYKDAAYAVAELIDNSIQSGCEVDRKTKVELICLEKNSLVADRNSSRIEQIAVYDNAAGMNKSELQSALAFGMGSRRNAIKGIGKFGMGLPNASISQCNRVDVYSWKNGSTFHTYLDINEIKQQRYDVVPEPQEDSVPRKWINCLDGELEESGTIVIWSDLDRLKWKRHKAFFTNVEFIVGRMYRYFIGKGCDIRMVAYNNNKDNLFNEIVKANDPLYLMSNTNTPEPFTGIPGFTQIKEEDVEIEWNGKKHIVKLTVSACSHNFRKNFHEHYKDNNYANPGATPFGKHCAKNLGISIVRAERELELNNSFTNVYDPTERFWGFEIAFSPELDEVFGVTNNKQTATALRQLSIDDIVQEEGFECNAEARDYLAQNNDIRLPVVEVSERVTSLLGAVRTELKKQREGVAKKDNYKPDGNIPAHVASKYACQTEGEGESDKKSRTMNEEEKKAELFEEIEKDGLSLSEKDMQELIAEQLNSDEKFIITSTEIAISDVLYDVTTPGGKLKVAINESHPFYSNLVKKIKDDDQAYDVIKLLFAAWALMEDKEQNEHKKKELKNVRMNWGYHAKKMLDEYMKAR